MMAVQISQRHWKATADGPMSELVELFSANDPSIEFITLEHGRRARGDKNVLSLAHDFPELKRPIYAAMMAGYVVYASDLDSSRFVRMSRIPSFWSPCLDGQHQISPEGLIYTLDEPSNMPARALLVVLSSMSFPFNKASLSRYFEPNFASVRKHIPDSAAILRIADLDGVVGGFYVPTVNYPSRDLDVAALIARLAEKLGLETSDVLLYGASKGGTAALNLGLRFGYSCIAVDPVVVDDYYETRYDDTHWTTGDVFLERKRDVFKSALGMSVKWHTPPGWAVVSGAGSPLYASVKEIAAPLAEANRALFLTSADPRITDHPHVSMRTLRTVTGLMNTALQGIPLGPGSREIFG